MKFKNLDYFEEAPDEQRQTNSSSIGRVRSIVAGWDKSSAYITGTGIITWDFQPQQNLHTEDECVVIQQWVAVPRTSYLRPHGSQREPDETSRKTGKDVGEVMNWVVLEHYVVFVTDVGKLFAFPFRWDTDTGMIHDSIELTGLQSLSEDDTTPDVADVQGSFRTFAIFKRNGEVLISNQAYLFTVFQNTTAISPRPLEPPKKIPALQNSGVIQIAIGDYHYHALHSSGRITSYGTEPRCSGALGLGGWQEQILFGWPADDAPEMMEALLRGLWVDRFNLERFESQFYF